MRKNPVKKAVRKPVKKPVAKRKMVYYIIVLGRKKAPLRKYFKGPGFVIDRNKSYLFVNQKNADLKRASLLQNHKFTINDLSLTIAKIGK